MMPGKHMPEPGLHGPYRLLSAKENIYIRVPNP